MEFLQLKNNSLTIDLLKIGASHLFKYPLDLIRFQTRHKIMYSIVLQKFSMNFKMKIITNNTSFVSLGLRPLGANKTGFNLKVFHFHIHDVLKVRLNPSFFMGFHSQFSSHPSLLDVFL